MSSRVVLVVVVLACGLVRAPSAHALDDVKPAPCAGGARVVDADDAPANPALDVRSAFFRVSGDQVTANIGVADLQPRVRSAVADRATYRMVFMAGAVERYVGMTVDRDGSLSFDHGTVGLTGLSSAGPTAGKVFPGPDGLVQIAVPPAAIAAGRTLERPYAVTGEENLLGFSRADRAPDSGAGASWPVERCGGAIDVVSLATPEQTIPYGASVTIAARTGPEVGGLAAQILARERGTAAERGLLAGTTAGDGTVSFAVRPVRTTSYVVTVGMAASAPVEIRVAPVVELRLRAFRGGLVFSGSSKGVKTGDVDIQARDGGEWFSAADGKVRGGRFRVKQRGLRGGAYRAVVSDRRGHLVDGASTTRRARGPLRVG